MLDACYQAKRIREMLPPLPEGVMPSYIQYLDAIQKLAEAKSLVKVGINDFIEAGFISSNQLVKVLGNGTLTNKLEVEAHAFSKTATAAIEAAGGTVVKL